MAVTVVKDADFETQVLKSKMPVLVDFFAEWCGPCKLAEPVLEELSEEYKDKIIVMKMDVDQNNQTPAKYGVMSIPTTVMIKDGVEVGRQIGFAGRHGFEEVIKKAI